jgi:hypothetical protein
MFGGLESMAERTFLFADNSGPDTVRPTSNKVEDVIAAIRNRLDMVGEQVPVLAFAKLNPVECNRVLNSFPGYKRCFQESGSMVMLDTYTFE